MSVVKKKHLDLLEPYITSSEVSIRGEDEHRELDMYCPLHEDTTRSATLDLDKGLWYCHACEVGGRVAGLIAQQDDWVAPPSGRTYKSRNGNGASANGGPTEEITEAKVKGWMSSLMSSPGRLEELESRRGLDMDVLEAYEIGWDGSKNCYTIPVRDGEGSIVNLRRYQFDPPPTAEGGKRRKMWSVKGMGSPARLFPLDVVQDDPEEVIVCEGEWDALLTIQNGFPAITRTASAGTWDAGWGEYFEGKKVYLIHDMDKTGQEANRKIARLLAPVADIHIVRLPYPVVAKHGKDLTDYWLEGNTDEDFRELLSRAEPYSSTNQTMEDSKESRAVVENASVIDTFDSSAVGKPRKVSVTIRGKREPGYSVPKMFNLSCTRDAGAKCKICPMNSSENDVDLEIRPSDPEILELIDSSKLQAADVARRKVGVPGKCVKLKIEATEYQAVEILHARPSIEYREEVDDKHKNIKITSAGRHDTAPNTTHKVIGALYPNPATHTNEFLAWSVEAVRTSLDSYEINDADAARLKQFRPLKGQRPLKRLGYIARDLSQHVTRIYGRPEMHAAMDLIFHSVISFNFGGQRIDRGWLEGLFVGDTRTGKSEAASRLTDHYQSGEVIACESASYAGIVGGAQQLGGGKEWAITWGAIPLNDRRLVVLDEVGGLSTDEIAAMSDVRSRGIAQITKITSEITRARTRLIWVGNPRDSSMAEFTYGVQAIRPLIGAPEDIARFDFAMSASAGDVSADEINREHSEGEQEFDSDLCSTLVRWVWSRRSDQIMWAKGAEDAVRKAAVEMGARYVEDPPLVQVANVRIKIARLAVALAARLFSTDATHEKVMVRREHVWDAVSFLDRIYGMRGFGYAELSGERIKDRQEAGSKAIEIRRWMQGRQGLARFLRSNPKFKRQDIEEFMNVGRDEANAIINRLWEASMVRKDHGIVIVEPALHELIRQIER